VRREIRDREGNVVERQGVTITVAYNRGTTAKGLMPGDRLYEDGKLVYVQEPDQVPDLMKALNESLRAVRARDEMDRS